jgi:hypothetical protein
VDGDELADLLIGAHFADGLGNGEDTSGSTYLINAADLAALDAADGTVDGFIDLSFVAATGTSYEFVGQDAGDQSGFSVSSAGDVDGDGLADLLIGAIGADGLSNGEFGSGSTYLINAADLAALDAADGTVDGIIDLSFVAATVTSYEFVGQDGNDRSGFSVSSAGDVDGDGLADLLIGAIGADGLSNGEFGSGSAYLIEADQLAAYDARDGVVDGIIDLSLIQCFLTGTEIATPYGPRPVETLVSGDQILTAEGDTVPVRFVFRQTIATRFGPPERLQPVRLRAGALGEGLPERDLVLTADHALMIDGLLINAGALVNGSSIDWVPLAELGERVTVYHVETENHDIILAEGAPTETYIDYAGRQAFDNYAEYVALYGADRAIAENPAPRISSARMLPAALCARLGIRRAA